MTRCDILMGPDPVHCYRWATLLAANAAPLEAAGVAVLVPEEETACDAEQWGLSTSGANRVIVVTPSLSLRCSSRAALAQIDEALQAFGVTTCFHVDIADPARMGLNSYIHQVRLGRETPVSMEMEAIAHPAWPDRSGCDPLTKEMAREAAPHWLDLHGALSTWRAALAPGALQVHGIEDDPVQSAAAFWARMNLPGTPEVPFAFKTPSPTWPGAQIERLRLLNKALAVFLKHREASIAADTRDRLQRDLGGDGAPWHPGHLADISARFAGARPLILEQWPEVPASALLPPETAPSSPPTAGKGFRATQYLTAFAPRLDRALIRKDRLPDHVVPMLVSLRRTGLAPRRLPDPMPDAPFDPAPGPATGTTVVACMKNEAPYILEWIAHHRALGVDRFLIYTNDCTDGTDAILARLDALGIVEHRENAEWRGKSPQQHALNLSLHEPAVRDARWVMHIDVDEFVNVRCGDGTLSALFEAAPTATHFALTWRLFGHSGVQRFRDRLVCEQFTKCAPVYCPKPHSAWGFKTLGRNINAYGKLGCHRPNKLQAAMADQVTWVNGSGKDITKDVSERGWRSNRASIGYDLVQLNHYALRSAESFLIKRDRGRALHVDREIGLNYWIRMDWSGDRDLSMLRHMPRLRAERDRLMQDKTLSRLHKQAVSWHREKARALRQDPSFAKLFDEVTALRLADDERAAWSLALSMES